MTDSNTMYRQIRTSRVCKTSPRDFCLSNTQLQMLFPFKGRTIPF